MTEANVDPKELIVARVAHVLGYDGDVKYLSLVIRRQVHNHRVHKAIATVATKGGWSLHEVTNAINTIAGY